MEEDRVHQLIYMIGYGAPVGCTLTHEGEVSGKLFIHDDVIPKTCPICKGVAVMIPL